MAISKSIVFTLYCLVGFELFKGWFTVVVLMPAVVTAIFVGGGFWCWRLIHAYQECKLCIDNLVYTYYLLNIKRCHAEKENYSLEFGKNTIPEIEDQTMFTTCMESLVQPLFQAYLDNSIIVESNVTTFVPHFNKDNLLIQLDMLLEKCGDVLEEYTKLDFVASWLLLEKYNALADVCDVMEDKWLEIDEMTDEVVCFFSKE